MISSGEGGREGCQLLHHLRTILSGSLNSAPIQLLAQCQVSPSEAEQKYSRAEPSLYFYCQTHSSTLVSTVQPKL